MTIERAQLIQDLAKIEFADRTLAWVETEKADNFSEWKRLRLRDNARADAWTARVAAAQFDPTEEAEFERVRGEYFVLFRSR